jgi:aquaporin TIP
VISYETAGSNALTWLNVPEGPVATSDRDRTLGAVEDPFRRAFAEFVGAFALIFVGAGSIATAAGVRDPSLIGIALAHGLAIAVMVSAVGHISGGHFNPAITLGFLATRRIHPLLAAIYLVSQLVAAAAAALLLKWIFPNDLVDQTRLGTPSIASGISIWQGVALEAVLTFFLVWVVFATAADARGTFKSIAGLAIGLTITMDVLIGGPLTGAAMNPARAFGPQLIQGEWSDAWVWYVGPIVGSVIAALAYEALYLRPLRPVPVGPVETGVVEPRPGDTAAS